MGIVKTKQAVYSGGMNDEDLIQHLGGPAKLAERLGYDKFGVQRVQNWKKRGIPPSVKLERPDLFLTELIGAVTDPDDAPQEA